MGGAPPLMGLGLIPLTAGSALIGSREILIAEYANILWKKVRGKELSREEALLAARLLQSVHNKTPHA
jgi:hypothetical protein